MSHGTIVEPSTFHIVVSAFSDKPFSMFRRIFKLDIEAFREYSFAQGPQSEFLTGDHETNRPVYIASLVEPLKTQGQEPRLDRLIYKCCSSRWQTSDSRHHEGGRTEYLPKTQWSFLTGVCAE